MAKKKKFYAVWEGRETGIFDDWDSCKKQIEGFEGAKYKSFESRQAAENALKQNYYHVIKKQATAQPKLVSGNVPPPIKNAVVVDAAWNSVSKDMEYQGFNYANGERLFLKGPFAGATNNIGEFLAIVHALALLKKHNSDLPIYSDSITAISWVRKKTANTKLEQTTRNAEIFDLIQRAETWLKTNSYKNKVLKWDTDNWGENPADFGRK